MHNCISHSMNAKNHNTNAKSGIILLYKFVLWFFIGGVGVASTLQGHRHFQYKNRHFHQQGKKKTVALIIIKAVITFTQTFIWITGLIQMKVNVAASIFNEALGKWHAVAIIWVSFCQRKLIVTLFTRQTAIILKRTDRGQWSSIHWQREEMHLLNPWKRPGGNLLPLLQAVHMCVQTCWQRVQLVSFAEKICFLKRWTKISFAYFTSGSWKEQALFCVVGISPLQSTHYCIFN